MVVGAILCGIIGLMWADLKSSIKDGRQEWHGELREHKIKNEKEHDEIWEELRRCKSECCPGRKRE
jgi:hypothetical protein